MKVYLVIPAPFVTTAEFARLTGQTERAVVEQVKNKQLPTHLLPPSIKQKETTQKRNKRFVDMIALTLTSVIRAGHDVEVVVDTNAL